MDNRIIIREYLENLREDQELDAIFPLLLLAKGFRLLATPASAKGQSQYGKDIVAIGQEGDTIYRYYFELKAGQDRHVDQQTLVKNDGIMMSLREAKYTPYVDVGMTSLAKYPVKYVLAHTGVTKENAKPTFEGFIKTEFPNGNFEQWNLDRLAEEFDTYLFNEYLIPNQEDSRLFRRVLLLLDTPDYNQVDFKRLVQHQLARMPEPGQKRQFRAAWATLVLLGQIVWHRCRLNNNLHPAIDALTYLLLSAWGWVLQNQLETKPAVLREFRRLISLHTEFLREYVGKTARAAALPNGLFVEGSGPFEAIGYPLRSFAYLGLLIYYFEVSYYYPAFDQPLNHARKARLEHWHKRYLRALIEANTACYRPILDAHNIPILATVLFILKGESLSPTDRAFVARYVFQNLDAVFTIRRTSNRLPSLTLNLQPLLEYVATGERPFNYGDRSSLLLPILMELLAFFGQERLWELFQPLIKQTDVDLQLAHPNQAEYNIEQALYDHPLEDEFYVVTSLELPATGSAYLANLPVETETPIDYRTDKAGFPYLRTLAHVYFQTELFPADWRAVLASVSNQSDDHDDKTLPMFNVPG